MKSQSFASFVFLLSIPENFALVELYPFATWFNFNCECWTMFSNGFIDNCSSRRSSWCEPFNHASRSYQLFASLESLGTSSVARMLRKFINLVNIFQRTLKFLWSEDWVEVVQSDGLKYLQREYSTTKVNRQPSPVGSVQSYHFTMPEWNIEKSFHRWASSLFFTTSIIMCHKLGRIIQLSDKANLQRSC